MEINDQTNRSVNNYSFPESYPPITTGEWMISMLLMSLPIVGIVLLFTWGFSGNINPNKANWAKATLLWMVIITVIYILVFGAIIVAVGSGFKEFLQL